MKKIILCAVIFFYALPAMSQALDSGIKSLSDDLASRIIRKQRKKVGLLDFVTESGKADAITKYIQEQVEFNLINTDLQVIDRKHIQEMLSENHLQSQGLLNESTVKSAVGFLKIEAWVIGEVIHVGNEVKIKLKVVDISSSQVFAAAQSQPIVDQKVSVMLQPKTCTDCNGTGTTGTKVTCSSCEGKGGRQCYSCGGVGNPYNGLSGRKEPCSFCNGKGKIECSVCKATGQQIVLNTCKKCNGAGKFY